MNGEYPGILALATDHASGDAHLAGRAIDDPRLMALHQLVVQASMHSQSDFEAGVENAKIAARGRFAEIEVGYNAARDAMAHLEALGPKHQPEPDPIVVPDEDDGDHGHDDGESILVSDEDASPSDLPRRKGRR